MGCNTRNIFLEKWYTKWDGEAIPRPFSKKSNLSLSLDQWYKVLNSLFLLYAKLRAIKTSRWRLKRLHAEPVPVREPRISQGHHKCDIT